MFNGLDVQLIANSLRNRVLEAAEQRHRDNILCMLYDENGSNIITTGSIDLLGIDEDETIPLDTISDTNENSRTESCVIDLTHDGDNNEVQLVNGYNRNRRRAPHEI